jgi:hypothetical protein
MTPELRDILYLQIYAWRKAHYYILYGLNEDRSRVSLARLLTNTVGLLVFQTNFVISALHKTLFTKKYFMLF